MFFQYSTLHEMQIALIRGRIFCFCGPFYARQEVFQLLEVEGVRFPWNPI